jgi:N-acyl homoserine lactone hydrolase
VTYCAGVSATAAPTKRSAGLGATALELPLPGGQDGATLTLEPLLCALMRGPRGWFERVPGRMAGLKALGIGTSAEDMIEVPIVAFLLEHPSAGLVLVDTGFHRSVAEGGSRERTRNLGSIARLMARGTEMSPQQTVAAQLKERGVDPADIELIVMTHLHFDHASALSEFPAATVVVSRPEWEAVWVRNPGLHGYVHAQLDPRLTYRTVEFAGADTRAPLGPTLDLFGDGSLTLVFTPGHTLGHMSLILRLSGRDALLTGDAAYTLGTLREGARPWRSEDPRAFERSVESLAAWDREHPGALVIPGHDIAAWRRLEDRYS